MNTVVVMKNRIKFPIEIIQKAREKVGKDFIIIYRLSMLDLIEDGSNWEEVVQLAKEIEKPVPLSLILELVGTKHVFQPLLHRCQEQLLHG